MIWDGGSTYTNIDVDVVVNMLVKINISKVISVQFFYRMDDNGLKIVVGMKWMEVNDCRKMNEWLYLEDNGWDDRWKIKSKNGSRQTKNILLLIK